MDETLISILACPACKGGVTWDVHRAFLVCWPCGLKYPVLDGIPVMLSDEAHPLGEDENGCS